MTKLSEISRQHWQMSMATAGEVVEGIPELTQQLRLIITTMPGSVPLAPQFGLGVDQYIDQVSGDIAGKIRRDLVEQVALYAPRIEILSVTVIHPVPEQIQITVRYQSKEAQGPQVVLFNI